MSRTLSPVRMFLVSSSSSRIFLRRNFGLSKQFSSFLARAHLSYLHSSSTSLLSKPIRPGISSSWYLAYKPSKESASSNWRFNHTMATQSSVPQSVHDFTVKDAKGNDVDLSKFKGKVLLIVNVASQCGLTDSNYTELTKLYEQYKDQGLEILAFPCNQFGSQEPGTNEEILQFACTRFKAEYPIFDKVEVNGANVAPIYKFLKSSKGGLFGDSIKWNFTKFLLDTDGHIVDRYAPTTSPLSIEKDIKKLLGKA